ncbi:MAG: hypothetical protein ACTSYB_01855 [Candidatus Helarchaeota archaeon]
MNFGLEVPSTKLSGNPRCTILSPDNGMVLRTVTENVDHPPNKDSPPLFLAPPAIWC